MGKVNQEGIFCPKCGIKIIWINKLRIGPDQEIKQCPFCGENPVVREDAVGLFDVCCIGCGASTGDYIHRDEAIEAWNRRQYEEAV